MSDWAVGDLAVLLDNTSRYSKKHRDEIAREGSVWRVFDVREMFGETRLFLEGLGTGRGCWAGRFRKIRPDEHEPCEAEFATLIQKSRKKLSA